MKFAFVVDAVRTFGVEGGAPTSIMACTPEGTPDEPPGTLKVVLEGEVVVEPDSPEVSIVVGPDSAEVSAAEACLILVVPERPAPLGVEELVVSMLQSYGAYLHNAGDQAQAQALAWRLQGIAGFLLGEFSEAVLNGGEEVPDAD